MKIKIKNSIGACRAVNFPIVKTYGIGDFMEFQLMGGSSVMISAKEMLEMNREFKKHLEKPKSKGQSFLDKLFSPVTFRGEA